MKLWRIGSTCLVFGFTALPLLAQEGQEQPRGNRLQRLVERFDKDGDGKLNDEEEAAARAALQGEQPGDRPRGPREGAPGRPEGRPGPGLSAEQIFQQLDQNKDGKISKDELGERGERLAQADANNDGEISKEELESAFARMREQAARAFNPEENFARMDQNGDGKLQKDELRGPIAERLADLDSDKDGAISKEEFLAGAARMREQAARAFSPEQIFARMDQNGDGKLQKDELRGPIAERLADLDSDKDGAISKEEFQAAGERLRGLLGGGAPGGPARVPSVDETFSQFDKNSDGKLTKEELPERAAEFILRADRDGDGAVTKEELQAARERIGGNRGDRRPGERRRPAEENKPEENK